MFTLVSEPGGGKTTWLINFIRARVKNGDRAIVIDPDGGEDAWNQFVRLKDVKNLENHLNFKGVVVIPYVKNHTFKLLRQWAEQKKLIDYMLVLDDINAYGVPDPEEDLRYFFKRKRQGGIDFFATGHSWMEVSASACRFTDYWLIGPASGTPVERAQQIGSKDAANNLEIWQQKANDDKIAAKRARRFHTFFSADKFGKHPKTGEPPK